MGSSYPRQKCAEEEGFLTFRALPSLKGSRGGSVFSDTRDIQAELEDCSSGCWGEAGERTPVLWGSLPRGLEVCL